MKDLMKRPGVAAAFTVGPDCARLLVNATLVGAVAGSVVGVSAGAVVVNPPSAANGSDVSFTLAGCKPVLLARTVIVPLARVARTLTRLMPASRSRYGWLVELIRPLL